MTSIFTQRAWFPGSRERRRRETFYIPRHVRDRSHESRFQQCLIGIVGDSLECSGHRRLPDADSKWCLSSVRLQNLIWQGEFVSERTHRREELDNRRPCDKSPSRHGTLGLLAMFPTGATPIHFAFSLGKTRRILPPQLRSQD